MIEFFSNENLHQKTEFPILAGDKATYPLQINTLNLEDSKNSLQIQIADIVASSLTFALNKKVKGEENEFTNEILNSKIFGFESSHYLFPSTDVDPESLGTKGTQNDESINHIVSMMTKNNEAYNSISDKLD